MRKLIWRASFSLAVLNTGRALSPCGTGLASPLLERRCTLHRCDYVYHRAPRCALAVPIRFRSGLSPAASARSIWYASPAGARGQSGYGPVLQASKLSTHVAFRDDKTEFSFSIDSKIKTLNFSGTRTPLRTIGFASVFNLALGIEAVYPANKVDFCLSTRRGEVQEFVAKAGEAARVCFH